MNEITKYARIGAMKRLEELNSEIASIFATFPDLKHEIKRQKLSLNAAKARAAIGKRKSGLTASGKRMGRPPKNAAAAVPAVPVSEGAVPPEMLAASALDQAPAPIVKKAAKRAKKAVKGTKGRGRKAAQATV